MPAGFRRHLVGKTLNKAYLIDITVANISERRRKPAGIDKKLNSVIVILCIQISGEN